MSTNVVAEWTGSGPDGRSSTLNKTISVADQTVNTTPTAVGTFTTAVVTADLARSLVFADSDGVPAGRYEKTSAGNFRKCP